MSGLNNKEVRVRFAPSPTGIPHVGNIRTALFNYFFAEANNGKFILRIEDTDQARKVEGAVGAIRDSLLWLGISWDGEVVQSENLEKYKQAAEDLVSRNLAKKDGDAIRFLVPKDGNTVWVDGVGNKKIEFQNSEVEDFIILKSDGFPTYHLANVVDDYAGGITHVIRGEDWISSTPKHILLYKAFGWGDQIPTFVHVPNIFGTDGKKLSKRHGAKSVLDLKNEGFLSEALLNYLMLLGFSPKDDREILSKQDFEREFDLSKINTAPAIFDEKKILWMNGVYIREKLSNEELKKRLADFYKDDDKVSPFVENDSVLVLAKTRMTTLADFKTLVEQSSSDSSNNKIREELLMRLSKLAEGDWKKEKIFDEFKKIIDTNSIRMPVLYKIFTGKEQGLPLPDFLQALGKNKTLDRLK